jgi:hypothetical protein
LGVELGTKLGTKLGIKLGIDDSHLAPRFCGFGQSSMSPSSKPSGWDKLPNELLLTILKQSPDISTLWSLSNTSARVTVLFRNHALETLNAVLEATVPLQARILMRAVLALRAGTTPCQNFLDAMDYLVEKWEPWPAVVASADVVMGFVWFAHKVHRLAHACLESCLQRCLSRPLLARRRYSPTFGQPTWTEEQRTVLALWRHLWIQLLKQAGRQGQLPEWPNADLRRLDAVGIFEYPLDACAVYQVLTVRDFLDAHAQPATEPATSPDSVLSVAIPASLRTNIPCAPAPCPAGVSQDATEPDPASPPDAAALALLGEPTDPERDAAELAAAVTPCAPPPENACRPWPPGYKFRPVRDYAPPRPPGREWCDLDAQPLGWQFWRSMVNNPHAGRGKYMALQAYCPYGLVLWEKQRVMAMGLWASQKPPEEYYQRWYALLSGEEVDVHKGKVPFCGDTQYP